MQHSTRRFTSYRLLRGGVLALTLAACQSPSALESGEDPTRANPSRRPPEQPTPPTRPPLRAVLIQLDGLPAEWLNRYLAEHRFLPGLSPAPAQAVARGGLSRLARGARAERLIPVDPTVTAPNMISMVTGAFPATHGVISNRFYRRGKRIVGFTEPPTVETLWQAAIRQHKRVVTYMAVGTQCAEAPPALMRLACWPTRGLVKWAHTPVSRRLPAAAQGNPPSLPGDAKHSLVAQQTLTLRAGPKARGAIQIKIGVERASQGKVRLVLPPSATLQRGSLHLAVGDSAEILWSGKRPSDSPGVPRRLSWITLRRLEARTGRAVFHLGGTAVNVARPRAFRLALDRAGIIRPAPADARGFQTGKIDERFFVSTALRELDALEGFARLIGPGNQFDLAILYVAVADELGHALFAPPGRSELTASETKRFHQALELGLRELDRRLARVLDALDLSRTRVLLASDHGMMGVRHNVSLRAALHRLDRRIRTVASGGSGLIHLPPELPAATAAGLLGRLRVAGAPVFAQGRIVGSDKFRALGLPAGAAQLFVQAGPGFSLSHRRIKRLSSWPRDMATHGHRSDLSAMHGVFLAAGPGIRSGDLGRLHITQIAAAVAQALGIRPPKQAHPGPIRLWR